LRDWGWRGDVRCGGAVDVGGAAVAYGVRGWVRGGGWFGFRDVSLAVPSTFGLEDFDSPFS
jgi:hypothetical protein